MSATELLNSSLASEDQQRLRVVDVGRWLWLVTAAVLVLGFLAVRALSGVDDAPRVEATEGARADAAANSIEAEPKETIHTLVPVTSQDPFTSPVDDQAGILLDGPRRASHDEWPPLDIPMEATSESPVVK